MKRVVIVALASCMFFTMLLGWQFVFATAPPGSCNVKDFGAKGDGVTNDTSAIKSAIATLVPYDTLYFPTGTYIVRPPADGTYAILPIALANLKIMGDGTGLSTIKVGDSPGATYTTYKYIFGPDYPQTADFTGLEVYNLTFDHNIAHNAIPAGSGDTVIYNWMQASVCVYKGNNINFHNL